MSLREVARVVSREMRETDLLAETAEGQLSVVLLDADLQSSSSVVDRLAARLDHYAFSTPGRGSKSGAACCPTDGADLHTLRRAAETHPARRQRAGRDSASKDSRFSNAPKVL